jgi:hypothetical protein
MLVLALQFSKGSERGRTFDISSNGALRGQRERELRAVRRGRSTRWVGSLKTEEKTKCVEPACQEDESCD